MVVKITTKSGSWFEAEGYYDDVMKELEALGEFENRMMEFVRADGGIPKPRVSVRVDSIEIVWQMTEKLQRIER